MKRLVNDTSIAQEPMDEVTYCYLELPQHDIVLAEGLPVEPCLDTGNRDDFANGGGPVRLFPDFSARVWEAYGCAKVVVAGPELAAAQVLVGRFAAGQHAA